MNAKKNAKIYVTAFVICIALLPNAFGEGSYFAQSGEKLGRGASNIVFAPLAAARTIERDIERDQPYRLVLVAPVEGTLRMVGRMAVGVYEMATFWVPQQPILKPAYQMPSIKEYLDEGRRPDLGGLASREGKTIEGKSGGFSV
ncbi:MAG: hypothetical protein A3G87_02805 [Omnitrophica bacterium RIFCSPLOWO2_12_FULL_50_11]|nr:MAG: hypothetical protein A3G87_02805 [Omnitrophica bacterium RIFCSPLOWO2_12_FULL_50_11]